MSESLSAAIAQAWDSFVPLMHWRLLPLSAYAFQPWIPKDAQSGLQMATAATESVSLCELMKKLTAFLELESAICVGLLTEQI